MSWDEVITCDQNFMGLTEDMTSDIHLWRSRIKIVDHQVACFLPLPWASVVVVRVDVKYWL